MGVQVLASALRGLGRRGDVSPAGVSGPLPEAPFRVTTPARHELTPEQLRSYEEEGFCVCRGWFTEAEIALLGTAIETDPELSAQEITVPDTQGLDTRLALWMQLGDDTCSMFARSASLVRAATVLMGGSEPYHSHSKVLLKEPGVGGAWEWHQDFGYYYNEGLLQPEKVTNVAIAVDSNTSRNGCMRFIKRSHTLGRVEHGVFGEQTGADPAMVARALRIPGFEEVELTMERGDICWFHSNLMHCSAANTSPAWRRNLITVFNSRHNEPDPAMAAVSGQPMYTPIAVVEDAAILSGGYKGLDPELNDFLDQEAASASIHEELGKAKAAED